MAYRSDYPEPFNDPFYEENCDDITTLDVIGMFSVIFIMLIAVILGIFIG